MTFYRSDVEQARWPDCIPEPSCRQANPLEDHVPTKAAEEGRGGLIPF